jgi:hypothetical protein
MVFVVGVLRCFCALCVDGKGIERVR